MQQHTSWKRSLEEGFCRMRLLRIFFEGAGFFRGVALERALCHNEPLLMCPIQEIAFTYPCGSDASDVILAAAVDPQGIFSKKTSRRTEGATKACFLTHAWSRIFQPIQRAKSPSPFNLASLVAQPLDPPIALEGIARPSASMFLRYRRVSR